MYGYGGAAPTLGYIGTVATPGYCGSASVPEYCGTAVFTCGCGNVLISYTPVLGGLLSSSLICWYSEYETAVKCHARTEMRQKRRTEFHLKCIEGDRITMNLICKKCE